MAGVANLLGSEVLLKSDMVSTASFAEEGKVIGLYFSAHWCPPCRQFTPVLAEWYKNFKTTENGKNFEIVFVSSDKDQAAFQEYYNEMPWHALPFSKRDEKAALSNAFGVRGIPMLVILDGKSGAVITSNGRAKANLSKKFKVQGIPKFVIVDGPSGELITGDGRAVVGDDPKGDKFPWRPIPLAQLLEGEVLKNKDEKVDMTKALEGKIRGFYFSAHWCPPCRSFTPTLCDTYNKVKAAGKNFELFFVSSDRSPDAFDEYFATMPFMAYPFGDERNKELSKHFEIEGIPSLIILDENNQVITSNGRAAVSGDKDGENFPWYPKPLDELSEDSVGVVNEEACLMYLSGSADTEGEDKAKELLTDVATEYSKEQKESQASPKPLPELSVLYEGPESDEIVDTIRTFASLPDYSPLIAILDIPSGTKYVHPQEDLSVDKVKQIFQDFKQEKLAFVPLKS